ncbi:MAG TPA: CPBP family intramembrane glutamic endopeptidase [Actinomycetota bacterium]|nr:CPBP family intramembrane glutamic endopeptidase [Actinomycetota bacterium]
MSEPPTPPRPDGEGTGTDVAGPGLPPPSWRPAEALPVFLVAVGVSVVAGVALASLGCALQTVVTSLVGELAFALAVVGWVRFVSRGSLAALGRPRRPGGDLGVGAVAGLGLVALAYGVLAAVSVAVRAVTGSPPPQPEQVAGCVRGEALALFAPVVILLAPLGEELYFRGFLYRGLRRRYGTWPSALVSGALFGVVHFGGLAFLLIIPSLVLVGVGLALLFEWRRSILAPMAAHAVFNALGYLAIVLGRT